MSIHLWIVYTLAVIGLSLTPGPNGLLALTHGARYGATRALATVAGGVVGFTALIALAMFGLGALLQTSADLLGVLKWIGGAYLLWLGFGLWRAPALHLAPIGADHAPRRSVLFRQGLLAAIANPKVLLFYGAFLPQFVDAHRPLLPQFIVMAATFALVEFAVEALLARLACRIRPWLERGGKRFNRCCGTLFALLGAALPLTR